MNDKLLLEVGGNLPESWQSALSPRPFTVAFQRMIGFFPNIIGSIILLVLGWLVANGIGKLVSELLKASGFNKLFEKSGWQEALKRAEVEVDVSQFLGAVCKWVLFFVFLAIGVEVLGLSQFAGFLNQVLAYIPSVIVSVLIFVAAVVISDILEKIVVASLEKAKLGYTKLAGLLVRWAIIGFSLLAILVQLGIAKEMVLVLFRGVVGFFVISLGLAFGLGGKEIAGEILRKLQRKLK